jgi:hypothetical protein
MTDFTKFVKSAQAPNTIRQVATDLGVNPQVRPPARPECEFPLTARTHAPAQQSRAEQSRACGGTSSCAAACSAYLTQWRHRRAVPHRIAAAIDCNGTTPARIGSVQSAEMAIHYSDSLGPFE